MPLARTLSGLAIGALLVACGRTPEAAREHMKRGDAALAEGRPAAALAAYSHARELAPADPAVQRAMMTARVHLIAEDPARLSADAFEDARYEAQILLDVDKPRAHVYLTALGNVLARQGDVEGAKLKYADALRANADSAFAHTALALALVGRKEGAAQAKAELEAALKAKPDHHKALVTLGQIKLAEGDLPGAVDKLEAALRGADDAGARMALGHARLSQQKPADAVEHFQRAAQLDPKNPDALGALGQALIGAGRADEAERALRTSLQMRPDLASEVALGYALARQKKLEPALAVFGQAIAEDPGSAQALFGAGSVAEELGRKEMALEYFRRLLSLPASRDRGVTAELQREAEAHRAALTAAQPATSAAPSAAPPAGVAPGPALRPPR